MEDRLLKTKRRRFLAFMFDFYFILFLSFSIEGLVGMVYKIDAGGYSNYPMFIGLMIVVSLYMFFGEWIFGNTLGKYLFGIEVLTVDTLTRPKPLSFLIRGLLKVLWPIEGLVLLFNKRKRRIGDYLGKTVVALKAQNKLEGKSRIALGLTVALGLYLVMPLCMGLGVKNSNFYKAGIEAVSNQDSLRISGLPVEVNQTGHILNFVVPVENKGIDQYASIFVEYIDGKWHQYYLEMNDDHSGKSFNFSYGSIIKTGTYDDGTLKYESGVRNKEKEGTCKFYYPNGQLQEANTWHMGNPVGHVIVFAENGQKITEFNIESGAKQGKATLWFDSGQIKEDMNYKDNVLDGSYESFYMNGQLRESGLYEMGTRVGDWKKYSPSGEKVESLDSEQTTKN